MYQHLQKVEIDTKNICKTYVQEVQGLSTDKKPYHRIQLAQVELANQQIPQDPKFLNWSPDWPLHLKKVLVARWRGGEPEMPQMLGN